jgi:hypothetical protein
VSDERNDDRDLASLLTAAGRRAAVPAGIVDAARGEWRRAVAARRRRTPRVWGALAAGAVLLVGAAAVWRSLRPAGTPVPEVARLESWAGTVAMAGVRPLSTHAAVPAGAGLQVGEAESHVALSMAGRSVRFAAGSEARLDDGLVELVRGAVYVDAAAGAAGGLAIRTPLATVQEIGTQFEVRLLDGEDPSLRVRVREGAVLVEAGEARERAVAGEEIRLRRGQAAARAAIAATATDWQWAAAAAPPFEIEGAELGEFLDWLARETAWRVVYGDADLERAARGIVMHGTTVGLSPEEAVAVVLPSSGLEYRLEGGVLRIDRGKS